MVWGNQIRNRRTFNSFYWMNQKAYCWILKCYKIDIIYIYIYWYWWIITWSNTQKYYVWTGWNLEQITLHDDLNSFIFILSFSDTLIVIQALKMVKETKLILIMNTTFSIFKLKPIIGVQPDNLDKNEGFQKRRPLDCYYCKNICQTSSVCNISMCFWNNSIKKYFLTRYLLVEFIPNIKNILL